MLDPTEQLRIRDRVRRRRALQETPRQRVQAMMRLQHRFLDSFDYVPGLPAENVNRLMSGSVVIDGVHFASLDWLRA